MLIGGNLLKTPEEPKKKRIYYFGDCPECKRPDMALYAVKGEQICGGCKTKKYRRNGSGRKPNGLARKPMKPPARLADVVDTAPLAQELGIMPTDDHMYDEDDVSLHYYDEDDEDAMPTSLGEQRQTEEAKEAHYLLLKFEAPTDIKLWQGLVEEARDQRRCPDQQALWIIQSHIKP